MLISLKANFSLCFHICEDYILRLCSRLCLQLQQLKISGRKVKVKFLECRNLTQLRVAQPQKCRTRHPHVLLVNFCEYALIAAFFLVLVYCMCCNKLLGQNSYMSLLCCLGFFYQNMGLFPIFFANVTYTSVCYSRCFPGAQLQCFVEFVIEKLYFCQFLQCRLNCIPRRRRKKKKKTKQNPDNNKTKTRNHLKPSLCTLAHFTLCIGSLSHSQPRLPYPHQHQESDVKLILYFSMET